MLTAIEIGKRIAQARKDKGFSQAQIANHLAVSPQAVGKWERGESLPDIITLDRLASFLGVDLNAFSEKSTGVVQEAHDDDAWIADQVGNDVVESKLQVGNDELESARQVDNDEVERVSRAGNDGVTLLNEPEATVNIGDGKVEATSHTHNEGAGVSGDPKAPKWDFSNDIWRDSDFSHLYNLADKLKGSGIKNCKFDGSDLKGLELLGNTVVESSFVDADMSNVLFKGSSLIRCGFDAASLASATLRGSSVVDCSFKGADLTQATIDGCTFKRCELREATLINTTFKATELNGISFTGKVRGCVFDNCSFSNTEFRDANITETFFKGKGLKKLRVVDCTVDRITYTFLQSVKANLENVTVED